MSYLNNSNLLPTHQSYCHHHSTETAVTKVYSDILGAADEGKLSLLILLDLSAAFDLVDHSISLKRLESTYGFDGLTLEWFKNYLSDRSFNVRCSGTKLDFFDSSVGVPQGSVLGPLLFSLHTGDLERIITGVRKYDHITPVLKVLHWLKIDERIEYKIALHMYKCLSNEGPAYLTRDPVPVASLPKKQRLRSAKSKDVVPNKHKLKSLGLRRFSVSGPKLWNNLLNSLKSSGSTKSFCRSLKTYLFNKSPFILLIIPCFFYIKKLFLFYLLI